MTLNLKYKMTLLTHMSLTLSGVKMFVSSAIASVNLPHTRTTTKIITATSEVTL